MLTACLSPPYHARQQRGTTSGKGAAVAARDSSPEMNGLRRNPKIEEAPLQSELMLFDPTTSKFFVMNPTMAFLWRKCDGDQPLPAIVESLSKEFSGVDAAVAEAELRHAVDELVGLGLLITEPRK
jgi:Coenzyme PQQ synthesis protein D (PqqD)